VTASLSVRLWSRVQKTDGCWIWTGGTNKRGYGKIRVDGRTTSTHRAAYLLAHGSIPQSLFVLHHCDTPSCVRPDHLYAGAHVDNMRDRKERDRTARGDKNGARLHPERLRRGDSHPFRLNPELVARGERSAAHRHPEKYQGEAHGRAKLTNKTVLAMRAEYAAGGTSTPKLARKYGIGKSQAHNIVSGRSWASLP
jgi:hypothetical protein